MSRTALLLLLAFGALTGTAHAGGWATVELGQAPGSLSTDEPWRVELIVKQHGVTPMDGLKPSVEITNDAGVVKTFPASPAGRTGTYVAEVTFPSAGTWRTRFYDGFTDVSPHRLSPITVSGASASADSGFPWAQATMIAVVALLFLAAIVAVSDRPRLRLGTVTLRGRAA
jgi:hypothetical protein